MTKINTKLASRENQVMEDASTPAPAVKRVQSLSIKSILMISLWFGLVTGFVDVSCQLVKKFGFHEALGQGFNLVWMTPLSNTLILLVIGLLFIPYSQRFPRVNKVKVFIFVLAFLAAFSAILYVPIAWYARDILAFGIGVACANLAECHLQAFFHLARRTSLALVLLVALSGIGLHVYAWNIERRALADTLQGQAALPGYRTLLGDILAQSKPALQSAAR